MKHFTTTDFQRWGAIGGAKSKRVLTPAQAKAMVAAREKKRRKTKRVVRRANKRIELHRKQLREFLARTCPEFSVVENYKAEP